MPDAPPIKLTEAERKSVVELFAFGYTTSAVIDELIKTHADWQTAPRFKIKEAIRTCNPNHKAFAKKYKELFESIKGQIRAERQKLAESMVGEIKEFAATWLHKHFEIIKSVSISPIEITAPRDLVALTKSLSDMVSVAEKVAALPIDDDFENPNTGFDNEANEAARKYLTYYRTHTGDETDDEGNRQPVEDPDTES